MTSPYEVLMPLAPWERPEVVQQAIEGLRAQSHTAARIVVSADGPPPVSLQRELDKAGVPLTLIVGPGGEGVGPVLARGLMACQEEVVVRVDADDISLPERCRIQVAAMEANPELAALSGPILEFIDDPDNPCGVRWVPPSGTAIQTWSRWRNPINHPAAVVRRSMVLAVGNYRRRPGFEDYDLWLRLIKTLGPSCLANGFEPLVQVRVGHDHLLRRRGLIYARKEIQFLYRCARENLLPWHRALLMMMLRSPARLIPAWILSSLTHFLLRYHGNNWYTDRTGRRSKGLSVASGRNAYDQK